MYRYNFMEEFRREELRKQFWDNVKAVVAVGAVGMMIFGWDFVTHGKGLAGL